MDSDERESFTRWRGAVDALTTDREAARTWRRTRYEFAHRLGGALVGAHDGAAAVTGSVVYGIWLSWGLLYVGQTLEASRRLRDLPVGSSREGGAGPLGDACEP